MAKRRQGAARKWAIGIGIVLVLYTLLGFLVLPAVIKSQMLKRLPALTHRNVSVQQVKLNPYALSFTLRGLSLTETNGEEFASLGELYVNFQSISLFKRGFGLQGDQRQAAIGKHHSIGGRDIQLLEPAHQPAAGDHQAGLPTSIAAGDDRRTEDRGRPVCVHGSGPQEAVPAALGADQRHSHEVHHAAEGRQSVLRGREHGRWPDVCLVGRRYAHTLAFRRHVQTHRVPDHEVCAVHRRRRARCRFSAARWTCRPITALTSTARKPA